MEWTLPNTKRLSKKMLDSFWYSFLSHGTSHSASAATLEHIMNRCEKGHVPFVLRAIPGKGYFIEVLEE